MTALEDKRRYYLTCAPLLMGISDQQLGVLARISQWRQYDRGDFLYLQGDRPVCAFVICAGWVVITLNSADGRELAISEMRDGELFGQHALIAGVPHTSSAVAREATSVLAISQAAFLDVLATEPRVVRRLLEIAAGRLTEANARQSALAFLQAPARIARLLREMDEKDRATADKGYITLSQEELALRAGLTRQTVARFLGEWRRNGWLLTGRGRIMLLHRQALLGIEDQNAL
ncbi:MAG TPA: Crp/Fnr family transcriptional regulator [Promineifilum sp.]|nr:Crp/Fnr family transcriptional regulator [Promineifilum sp.]HQF70238.1 Crp/Fnr family transcriptional regulator [Promineifilum sp.]